MNINNDSKTTRKEYERKRKREGERMYERKDCLHAEITPRNKHLNKMRAAGTLLELDTMKK